MAFGRLSETGPYQIWVARLKKWSRDPATSLDGLPSLDDATFDQETYGRLMEHLNTAMRIFMDNWHHELSRAFDRASNDHEIASELVRLRHLLEPRLHLAKHPNWPPAVRNALMSGFESDLRSIQSQIEQALVRPTDRGRSDAGRGQQLADIARRNSLLYLLAPSTSITEVNYAPPPPSTPTPPLPPRPTRRILF